jgi:nucleotide-binding universal stress UspA family protein
MGDGAAPGANSFDPPGGARRDTAPVGYIFAADRALLWPSARRLALCGPASDKFKSVSFVRLENRLAIISTLIACLSTDRSNGEMLAVVADLAQRLSATVIGLWVRQISTPSSILAIGPAEPRGREFDKFRERAAAAEAEFRSALPMVSTLGWRAQITAGPASHYVANEACAADLIVTAIDPGERVFSPTSEIEVADLIMRSGRPVLMAPPGVIGLKLTRALVCWKDSREARLAITDALPLLKASQAVDVVQVVGEHEIETARDRLADVGDWFHRQGVEANCFATPVKGTESVHLAQIARELEADLIVAGAFGHSRLREWAFGGVTRDLLVRAERCTLVSH